MNNYNSVSYVFEVTAQKLDARTNLCSLKKKIGEPAGTDISTIESLINVRFG